MFLLNRRLEGIRSLFTLNCIKYSTVLVECRISVVSSLAFLLAGSQPTQQEARILCI